MLEEKVFFQVKIYIHFQYFQNFLKDFPCLQIQNYKLIILFQLDEKPLCILLLHYSNQDQIHCSSPGQTYKVSLIHKLFQLERAYIQALSFAENM